MDSSHSSGNSGSGGESTVGSASGQAEGSAESTAEAADGNPDSDGSSDSGEPDPLVECHTGYPWVECDECTDIAVDIVNCGACDHVCHGAGNTNSCVDYLCAPALAPCIDAAAPFETCTDACASVGETCSEDAECAGVVGVYLVDSFNPNPTMDLNACLAENQWDHTLTNVDCDAPLDWDAQYDERAIVGMACCCTQP